MKCAFRSRCASALALRTIVSPVTVTYLYKIILFVNDLHTALGRMTASTLLLPPSPRHLFITLHKTFSLFYLFVEGATYKCKYNAYIAATSMCRYIWQVLFKMA